MLLEHILNASNDTLIPVLEKHKNAFGEILEEVTALQRLQI